MQVSVCVREWMWRQSFMLSSVQWLNIFRQESHSAYFFAFDFFLSFVHFSLCHSFGFLLDVFFVTWFCSNLSKQFHWNRLSAGWVNFHKVVHAQTVPKSTALYSFVSIHSLYSPISVYEVEFEFSRCRFRLFQFQKIYCLCAFECGQFLVCGFINIFVHTLFSVGRIVLCNRHTHMSVTEWFNGNRC